MLINGYTLWPHTLKKGEDIFWGFFSNNIQISIYWISSLGTMKVSHRGALLVSKVTIIIKIKTHIFPTLTKYTILKNIKKTSRKTTTKIIIQYKPFAFDQKKTLLWQQKWKNHVHSHVGQFFLQFFALTCEFDVFNCN